MDDRKLPRTLVGRTLTPTKFVSLNETVKAAVAGFEDGALPSPFVPPRGEGGGSARKGAHVDRQHLPRIGALPGKEPEFARLQNRL